MNLKVIRRCVIALAAWLPFFALWVLFAMSFARDRFSGIFLASLISMGSAGLLGTAVWHACRRWPWPLGYNLSFYSLHVLFALLYAGAWTIAVYGLESLRYFREYYGKEGSAQPAHWLQRQKVAVMESSWGSNLLELLRHREDSASRTA